MTEFSDYIVFVDESGDHSLTSINPEYPVFVLAFCMFEKRHYADVIQPAVARLKFAHFGHDAVVLHEHEIRKQIGPFSRLTNRVLRDAFMADLNRLMDDAEFTLIAAAIRKHEFKKQYANPEHPYHLALEFGLERLGRWLADHGQAGRLTHVVCEQRGGREDRDLELAFRRVCDGYNFTGERMPLDLVMVDKKANSAGLQFSDLVARPIGRHVLQPDQPNRAWDTLSTKLRRSPGGRIEGWGLKVFP